MIKKKLLTDRSGMLYEQYLEQAAKDLADDIDAEIVKEILVDSGWVEVVLTPMTFEQGDEIDFWVHRNIKGKNWTRGLVWLFEKEQDATWFKLRWLS